MMVASLSVKAQEITITLRPGYTWISYPNAVVMDIPTALGDFVPMEGDIIKSQNGSTIFHNGSWRGFQDFIPGFGYKYFSNRTESTELVFASSFSVTTIEPTDITATSAVLGGTINAPEGTHVFLRGVCWGTEPNPDIDDNHTSEETGIGSFTSTLEGLSPRTVYYVRAYAVSDFGLAYVTAFIGKVFDYLIRDIQRRIGLRPAAGNLYVCVGSRRDKLCQAVKRRMHKLCQVRRVGTAFIIVYVQRHALTGLCGKTVELLPVPMLEIIDFPSAIQDDRIISRVFHDRNRAVSVFDRRKPGRVTFDLN